VKRILLFAVLLVCTITATAQVTRMPVAVFYPSIGAYSSQSNDAFSFRSNTAALAGVEHFSAGIFSERRFLLEELSGYSFAVTLPTSTGNFGLKGDYFGGRLFNEATLGFAYGRKLGEKAAVGLGFNYVSLNASGYGSASALTFDAGAIFQLTEHLQTGFHAYNPVEMKISKTREEKLPALYSIGLGYDVSPQFYIGTEIVKTEGQPLSVNTGFHYAFVENLVARGGISSATSVYYVSFGVQVKSFRIDATASFHPYLGTTPGLLFIYAPQK
jgi:hypothetical protein